MRIAIAQINPIVGDLDGNTAKILSYMAKAKDESVDLVIFPELAITGYPPKDLILKPKFIRDNQKQLDKITRQSKGIAVIVGFVHGRRGKIHNSAAFIRNGRFVHRQNKLCLPNDDVFTELRYFAPGKNHRVFKLADRKIGIPICNDIWQDSPVRQFKKAGANLIISIAASPYHVGKPKFRKEELSKKAKSSRMPLVYCNLVGGQDEIVFDGRSSVFDSKGRLIAQAKAYEEDFITTDLKTKQRFEKTEKIKEIHDALILGVKDYCKKNGFKQAVIGLSGGIDSAVTAALAVEALGKENVLGVSLPGPYSSKHSVQDAKQLAKNLGIKFLKVDIKKIYREYVSTLRPSFKGMKPNIAEENIQARIRGNILFALSNKYGYIVLSTGNKSELAVGYCTLYGDLSGGLAVLGDVYKKYVYELAKFMKTIPKNTIKKAPSAELRPNQKDSDSLPDYRILDKIIKLYVEDNKTVNEIANKGISKKTVKKVIKMIDCNEYKRKQAPPSIKITTKAFGSGRQMPITNRY